jgi:Holliday junction DNA helicase RuvA
MIATLSGRLTEKLPDALILEVAGIGYELFVTIDDWGAARLDADAHYYIYEQIREDAHNLYGFSTLSARQLFTQLIGVNGVGPKVALSILSSAREHRLRQAIASGDPALLKGVSGVGPKTAQRVILDLRGKVQEGSATFAPVADSTYQALIALGYTSAQATQAVSQLPPDLTDDQARLKAALKGVGK